MLPSTSPLTLHQLRKGFYLHWNSKYIYSIFKRFTVKVFILIFLGSIFILGWVEEAIADEKFQITQEKFNNWGHLNHHPLNTAMIGDFVIYEEYWMQIIDEFPFHTATAVYSNQYNLEVKNQNRLKVPIWNDNKSIEMMPNETNFYLNGNKAWGRLKRWNKAITDYNHNPESDFKDVMAYNKQSDTKVDLGNWNRVIADYQKATEINPEFLWIKANQALELYETGKKENAITMMKNIVRKYPQFADMRAALTAAYWANGQLGEAKSHWISAYGLDSRYKDIYWVENVRCWPPSLIIALKDFLKLQ